MEASGAGTYFDNLSSLLKQTAVTDLQGESLALDDAAAMTLRLLDETRAAGRKVMLVGNGGSAAIVSHAQNDLCKSLGVRSLVFNEQPLLTALANDHGYGCVFERPVELWAEAGDILLAVSSSGQSDSILRPAEAARQRGCHIVTFSGFTPGNRLRAVGDVNYYINSDQYGYVELAHQVLLHYLTDCALGAAGSTKRQDGAR